MHRDEIRIDEPCHERWAQMSGDERRRFCASCRQHVHDLSAMTERQARELLRTEPDVCVRYTTDGWGRLLHLGVAAAGALLATAPALASTSPAEEAEPGLLERAYEAVSHWWYGEEAPPSADPGCASPHDAPVDTGLEIPPKPQENLHEVKHVTMGKPSVHTPPVIAGAPEIELVARIETRVSWNVTYEVRCGDGTRQRFSRTGEEPTTLHLGAGACNVMVKGGPVQPAVPVAAGDDLVCELDDDGLRCVPR